MTNVQKLKQACLSLKRRSYLDFFFVEVVAKLMAAMFFPQQVSTSNANGELSHATRPDGSTTDRKRYMLKTETAASIKSATHKSERLWN